MPEEQLEFFPKENNVSQSELQEQKIQRTFIDIQKILIREGLDITVEHIIKLIPIKEDKNGS